MTEILKKQEIKSIQAMIRGQEEERRRIANDLHDRLGSILSMAKLHYQSSEEHLKNLNTFEQKRYSMASALLDEACAEVRNISHNMISGILTKFGLIAALEDLTNTINGSNIINIDLIVHGFENRLESEIEINIYRIIQELINNVIKHANANEITIQLIFNNNGLNLMVEDDGNGFDVNNKSIYGMGLKNVLSRVDQINGELNMDSLLGKGTTITMDIPLNELVEL
ncbi:sensor histidine kinase [uncultured Aquimarina sp.]|uniref:sensor histidine kinase n=1 Tax=uncultured Aquimarina sp. TaxID=575652 RepID=UPI002633A924|nr:sensor histidine kinase [uncultured Aquimarina sp.]